MEIRTTAPYLESCLSLPLLSGDLAHEPKWAHIQLRDSVGISPTSLARGASTIAQGAPRGAGTQDLRFSRDHHARARQRSAELGTAE